MPINLAQRRIAAVHKKSKFPSLREHAMYNSFYARELKKASRRIYALQMRIKELEKERHMYLEQVMRANMRVESVLSLGQEEETMKHEIRQLRNKKDDLILEINRLKQIVNRLRYNLREGYKRN